MADGSLTKVANTDKGRTTPSYDDLSVFSLVNDTRVNVTADGVNSTAFMLLQKVDAGVYQIMFRAHYSDFPLTVNFSSNYAYWMSTALQNFYFIDSTGTLITVFNISDSNRDFNRTTSNWTLQNIASHLRTGNSTSSMWGLQNVNIIDSMQAMWLPYGPANAGENCDDGSALFFYQNATIFYAGDEVLSSAYWVNADTRWWVYSNNYNIIVTDYLTGALLLNQTYNDAQFTAILSRYNLGAWVGPLVTLIGLWIAITIFFAVFCRRQC